MKKASRPYRMQARSEAAERTGRVILASAAALWRESAFEDLTLQAIAERAGVSVQTVIRRYGSKEGVVQACMEQDAAGVVAERERAPVGDLGGALAVLLRHYERDGDTVLRPLVVVGLSSTFQDQRGALQRVASALGTLEVRGLLTLGPAMEGAALDLPENVIAVASTSHAQVFPHASAVVTHAGHGTVMRALAQSLPLLCLPMGRDQDDNAARVVAHGVGLRLRPSASPARIASALRRLLGDPTFRANAEALGRLIAADAEADRAVGELEAVGAVAAGEGVPPAATAVPR